MMKKVMLALACAVAMGTAQAEVLLVENFDNVNALRAGDQWIFENASVPPGIAPGWVQGNPDVFEAHMGEPNAYIASSFQSAAPNGQLDDRLFTPLFSLENGAVATFWLRGANDPGFFDMVVYGYTDGGADPLDFILQEVTIAPDGWTQYSITIEARAGNGRLGFVHTGPEATSNYVGLDTLRIVDQRQGDVPEPATLLIMGIGLAGLAASRRRA
jgi:hypothetical protein